MPLKQPPLKKNDDITLRIDALTNEGGGVGRVEGYAVFVPSALPRELVRAHVIKVTASYAVAKPLEILEPAAERVRPRCAAYPACGGCTMQHLAYTAQLAAKERIVRDAFTRLGGFENPPLLPMRGMEEPWRYRNKGSFPFGSLDGAAVFGFYAPRSHRLVPLADCPIQDERALDIVRRVAAWANENRIPPYDETAHTGTLRQVVARVTQSGERLAVVVTRGPLTKKAALINALEGVESLWHNQNDQRTNVIFGERFEHIGGRRTVEERLGALRFSVSPQSFLQVNPVQTEALYSAALELLAPAPDEAVIDAYCGIGTISLLLAGRCRRVIGIEQAAPAVEDARRNALLNGVRNAEFLCGSVEELLPGLLETARIAALVLDPPRKGCGPQALEAIGKSGISRLVYVSCHPATLARDCAALAAHGFSPAAIQPVDMFPHTGHVETVVLLSKGEIDSKKVRVEFSLEDMDMSDFQDKATYTQIKEYVLEHTGLKVSNLYISQIKRKCGLEVGKNYNLAKSEDSRQPQCPPEKENAIREAFEYFGMI
ncbi:MAG: 23S rRNA (uracil(1939)-C(5))-methyltransferase RlmD [Clostridia bacterium]|nr:23S rRNA (uracil(1939)-C(5))-methyltransferase RlmD [Clostridia bacterium]